MATSSITNNSTRRVYQIDRLISVNYPIWSIKLEMLLLRSELWLIVNGIEPKPAAIHADRLAQRVLKNAKMQKHVLI